MAAFSWASACAYDDDYDANRGTKRGHTAADKPVSPMADSLEQLPLAIQPLQLNSTRRLMLRTSSMSLSPSRSPTIASPSAATLSRSLSPTDVPGYKSLEQVELFKTKLRDTIASPNHVDVEIFRSPEQSIISVPQEKPLSRDDVIGMDTVFSMLDKTISKTRANPALAPIGENRVMYVNAAARFGVRTAIRSFCDDPEPSRRVNCITWKYCDVSEANPQTRFFHNLIALAIHYEPCVVILHRLVQRCSALAIELTRRIWEAYSQYSEMQDTQNAPQFWLIFVDGVFPGQVLRDWDMIQMTSSVAVFSRELKIAYVQRRMRRHLAERIGLGDEDIERLMTGRHNCGRGEEERQDDPDADLCVVPKDAAAAYVADPLPSHISTYDRMVARVIGTNHASLTHCELLNKYTAMVFNLPIDRAPREQLENIVDMLDPELLPSMTNEQNDFDDAFTKLKEWIGKQREIAEKARVAAEREAQAQQQASVRVGGFQPSTMAQSRMY